MKKRILFILIVVLLCSLYVKNVSASELCSPSGYSIYTINGINTDKRGAQDNKTAFQNKLKITTYNNQPLTVDYLYNPTHLAGVADLIDVVKQGFFDQKSDYDLVEMLNDASQKVTTQKLLLVAHSQGNFYANNFYDKVASQEGGVPSQSIGVYGVATPANRIPGGGKYLTSDTDGIIASLFGNTLGRNIMSPNTHIIFQNNDDQYGHDFSKVYLKYQGDKIVSDIKSSLDKLKNNDEQESGGPCISPPELSTVHKIQKVVLAVADPAANITKDVAIGAGVTIYNTSVAIGNKIIKVADTTASAISSFTKSLKSTVGNLAINDGAAVILSNGGVPKNTNVADSAKNSPSPKSSVASVINKIKTLAVAMVEPNTASAENNDSPSQPTEDNLPNNNKSANSGNGGGGGGGSSGSGESASTPEPEANPPEEEDSPAPDITPPVISIVGDNPVEVTKNTVYTDAGVTALDDVDGDITANVITVNPVDVNTMADYTITYNVKDAAKNLAIQVTRLVHVVAPPLVTTTIDQNTTLVAGEYNYENLIITNNAVLTLEGDPASANSFKGVKITAINLIIDPGSSISADAKGYGSNQGPGASSESSVGASYGGLSYSGTAYSITYGSATKPTDLGSGGVVQGGGAIQIVVSDTFTDNGIVSSDGGTSSSGGSIYVTAKNIAGSGVFHANGGGLMFGSYYKSPGGGGRIAIYYQTSSFNGIIEAKGGCGSYSYPVMSCGQNGTIGVFDESTNDLYLNNSWKFLQGDAPFSFNNIFISNGAKVTGENGVNITANNILVDKNSYFTLADNQILNIPTITVSGSSTLTLSGGETITANILSVKGNGIVTVIPEKILSLTIPNINIDAGSSISADSKGYGSNQGPGASSEDSIGASYGGLSYGAATYSKTYGSATEPTDLGSGGATFGGGAMRIMVSDTFTNNGIISSNGSTSSSGGSIYVTAQNFAGSGVLRANGGGLMFGSYYKSPGGGGRIAVYYQTSLFNGTTEAKGGCGSYSYPIVSCGQDGTVHIVDESIPPLSSAKSITLLNFTSLTPNVTGVIDETNHTISLTVPFNTNVTTLAPTIAISSGASINPNNNVAQNFTSPVTYTVTAEDGSTQNYIVTVTITPDPGPDSTPPSITSYTMNSAVGNITVNPTVEHPLSLAFTASKNVDWVSIKIEKENSENVDIHKYYYPGNDCDGKNTCTQDWDGKLIGELLQNGTTYKIKVKVRDLVTKIEYDYFSPYVITVNTSI
jgi:hypothetical protein